MPFLVLNEDSTNFFIRHPEEDMCTEGLDAWVELYVGTQVGELVFNTNCQRSSYNSTTKVISTSPNVHHTRNWVMAT